MQGSVLNLGLGLLVAGNAANHLAQGSDGCPGLGAASQGNRYIQGAAVVRTELCIPGLADRSGGGVLKPLSGGVNQRVLGLRKIEEQRYANEIRWLNPQHRRDRRIGVLKDSPDIGDEIAIGGEAKEVSIATIAAIPLLISRPIERSQLPVL